MKKNMRRIHEPSEIFTVTVRVGESDDPEGRTVRWKTEKQVDLILDQFGKWLAGLIRPVPGAATPKTVTLKDTGGTNRTVYVFGTSSAGSQVFNGQLAGTRVGVGSSNQAAARTDYNLISQLGSLAETNDGLWDSGAGTITFVGSVYLSAGGTVRETGFFGYWYEGTGSRYTFMLFRDVISDVVIGAGKYAHIQYTINL